MIDSKVENFSSNVKKHPQNLVFCMLTGTRTSGKLILLRRIGINTKRIKMLLAESDALERMESPLNLLNRLRSAASPKNIHSLIPSIPTDVSDIVDNLEKKIQAGALKSKASNIMSAAMDELLVKLPEISKPENLARIASEMNKIVNAEQAKSGDDNRVGQIMIYAPQLVSESHFDIIDAKEIE